MLEELKIENFLSWVDLTFRPKNENLVIGLNNSGKTNLCKALQFLTASTNLSLDECAGGIGVSKLKLRNFGYERRTIDFTVRASLPLENEVANYCYSLSILPPGEPIPDAKVIVVQEKLTIKAQGFDGIELFENTDGNVRLLHETNHLRNPEENNYVGTFAPQDTTMLCRLYDLETNRRANLFKRYLQFWQYYDLCPSALRASSYQPNEFWLRPDGSNLASVIYRLKKTDEKSYRELVRCLQLVEPRVSFINFVGGDAEPNVFMTFEHNSGASFPAWTASGGTLRFLALSYILSVQPPTPFVHSPLVMIEEPENGIYVGLFKELLDLFPGGSQAPQLIFTSHSPYFIDLFDDKLESVFVVKRDEYRSVIANIDIEKARKRLADYPLGHQHFREMLS